METDRHPNAAKNVPNTLIFGLEQFIAHEIRIEIKTKEVATQLPISSIYDMRFIYEGLLNIFFQSLVLRKI